MAAGVGITGAGAVSRRARESHPGIVQPIRLIFDGVRELVDRRPYTALQILIRISGYGSPSLSRTGNRRVLHPDRSAQTM
jgi:hypothetical protein